MQTKKEQTITLTETQTQRAFWLSLGSGVMMLLTLAVLLLTSGNRPLTSISDIRVFLAIITLCGFISAWLTRHGKTVLGISLILGAFYIFVFWTALYIENLGVAIAAVTMTLTFGITSAVMPSTRPARYANIAAGIMSAVVLLLDIFRPFERAANDSPDLTWGITIFLVLVYGFLVLRQFSSYNLRTKLLIAFLTAALIPLAILVYINDGSTRETLTDSANAALLSAASSTAGTLDTFITENLDLIRAESQLPVIVEYLNLPAGQRANSDEETRALKLIAALASKDSVHIDSIAILDTKGITLVDTFTDDIGVNKSDRSWFQKPLETGILYASDLEFSQTNGAASIYFSAPVRNAAGKIIGVFRTRYKATILQKIISSNNNQVGQGSFAVLVDAQSNVRLAHGTTPSIIFKSVVPIDNETLRNLQAKRLLPPGTAEELSTNLPNFEAALNNANNQPLFAAELKAGAGTLEQGAIAAMKTQKWYVVYAQEQEVILAPINAKARTNLVLGVIMAVLVAGFSLLISTTLSGPITRLTRTAEAIAGGDINIQAKVETGDEIGSLAQTFNSMTAQLRGFITSLEERVAARTKDLATVAEVGTATATILETDKLLQTVVNLTKERFSLYHSHIYLLDEKGENLVLTAGAGEPGRIMAAEKRSIPVSREQSLVARAAREQKGVTVNDVTLTPDFLPNPLLPNTRSELAVPMIVGGKVIGVFDVQSDQVGRFTDSDINIQTTLAAQISTSIQNVRSFEQSKAQATLETLVNSIGQKIQRATTVEDTLQTAIREIGVALGASRVSVNIQASSQQDGSQASRN